jgi:hypothetical protein
MKTLKTLFCLAVVGLALYSALQFALPYFRFYTFRSDVRDMMRFELQGPGELKALVLQRAAETGVPLQEEDLEVEASPEGYLLWAQWTEEVNLFGQYQRYLDFEIKEGPWDVYGDY